MRNLTDSEAFAQIIVRQSQHEWFMAHWTSTLPNYEYDAAGIEYTVFRIKPDLGNFRLV